MKTTFYPHQITVEVCRTEVLDFRKRWPGSDIPDAAVTFHFSRQGELQDIDGIASECQGPALAALVEDAWSFAIGSEEAPR